MKKIMKIMLPIVRTFNDLHITANLELAIASLKGLSGIYCIRHIASGKIYIGQALDLSVRIIQHLNGISSNIHLQHAFKKYGIWPGRARQHIMNHEYMIHNVCLCPAGANFEFMARQAPHTRQLRPLGATDVCVWRKAGVVEFVEDTSLLTTREQVHLDLPVI